MTGGALGLPAERVAAAKLQVNTRQWVISRLLPKKYGDVVTQEVSGPDGGPIVTQAAQKATARRQGAPES